MKRSDILWRLATLRYMQLTMPNGVGNGPALIVIREAINAHEDLLKSEDPETLEKLRAPFNPPGVLG